MKMLPLRPRPKPSESFASWVQRVAAANGLTLEDFVRIVRKQFANELSDKGFYAPRSPSVPITPDSIEQEPFVVLMTAATGAARQVLDTLTWKSETPGYFGKFLTPAGRKRSSARNSRPGEDTAWYADSYCPECLADDFYLRRLWRPAFPCVCLVHERVLMDCCPNCRAILGYYAGGQSNRGRDGSVSILRCHGCGFNLSSVPGQRPAHQHLNLIKFLARCYAKPSANRLKGDSLVLHVFNWLMEAYFQTCTALPRPPMVYRTARRAQHRAAYTYESCRVRHALFETACKAIGRAGSDSQPWEPEDSDCMEWMGRRKWTDFRAVADDLVRGFPELLDQSTVVATDRSILPSP